MFRAIYALLTTAALAATLACAHAPAPEPTPQMPAPAAAPEEIPLIKGPISDDGLQAIFATPDLGVGKTRVAFALTSQSGLVNAPTATVRLFHDPRGDDLGEPVQTALAIFRPFPLVERGLYSTKLTFDRPGAWAIEAAVPGNDGAPDLARLFFDVADRARAPSVGTPAIPSASKTVADVERLSQLTTGSLQDEDLYRVTIADATESGLPTVIVMASPAFCINAVCGPQVEVLQQLKDEFAGQANFIHVDYYDNPEEIQGDLSRAVLSPAVVEWNLPSAEWSFVLDAAGIVSARFEGFATLEELRQALRAVL